MSEIIARHGAPVKTSNFRAGIYPLADVARVHGFALLCNGAQDAPGHQGAGRTGTVHEPVACQIRVQGVLDQKWSEYMGGLTISLDAESGPHPVTTLTGELLDQAALVGVLDDLYNLLMPLISVECTPVGSETYSEKSPRQVCD